MSARFSPWLIAACAAVLLLPSLSDAQIVSRTAGGGLHVSAPFVDVNIPSLDVLSARNPMAGRRFFGRRRALPPQQPPQTAAQKKRQQQARQQPTPQVPDMAPTPVTRVPATAPGIATDTNSLPTPKMLAAMDVADLKATLQQVSSQLQKRLSRLATGAGWQRHLQVPGEVLLAPAQNLAMVKKTLAKFDAVAGNPRFATIAGMPSFIATGATLRQLAAISNGPLMTNPAVTNAAPVQKQAVVEGILPTPAETERPNATRGERSILKRASR